MHVPGVLKPTMKPVKEIHSQLIMTPKESPLLASMLHPTKGPHLVYMPVWTDNPKLNTSYVWQRGTIRGRLKKTTTLGLVF